MRLINTRSDLDAIAGTPEHDDFINVLKGSIYRLEKDDTAKQWALVTDTSTIEKYGFTLADFSSVTPPDVPVYVAAANPRIAEIKAELVAIDLKSIRPAREGDTARLATLEAQAQVLRSELSTL